MTSFGIAEYTAQQDDTPQYYTAPGELHVIRATGRRVDDIGDALDVLADPALALVIIHSNHAIPVPAAQLPPEQDVAVVLEGDFDFWDTWQLGYEYPLEFYAIPVVTLSELPYHARYARYQAMGGPATWEVWHENAVKQKQLQDEIEKTERHEQNSRAVGYWEMANEKYIEAHGLRYRLSKLEDFLIV